MALVRTEGAELQQMGQAFISAGRQVNSRRPITGGRARHLSGRLLPEGTNQGHSMGWHGGGGTLVGRRRDTGEGTARGGVGSGQWWWCSRGKAKGRDEKVKGKDA